MSFRPTYDVIVLEHGSHAMILRPSLRAASTLERSHAGFANLFRRVSEFHLGTVHEIIMQAATDRKEAIAFLQAVANLPLRRLVEIAQAPIANLCLGFIPAPDPAAKSSPNAKPQPWPAFYREQFRIATGWLGWTPDQAWNATPTEISEALAGHIAMLKAVHGATDSDAADNLPDPNGQLDRDGLNKLRGKGRLR
ncbi:MAG TPA: hypothetical protein VGO06_06215 [Bosea sp. (in: a-proteobacteria)]|jgi:hypothetical protein|uniref:hypothetical protein n=1 Tax=Bosea sp. (in: a-proteobacteria) TaxID=1871050 RepID=UPI002E123E4F|nr:hypothetical protein [Bosea sp. (in: a-proteobacteria)]